MSALDELIKKISARQKFNFFIVTDSSDAYTAMIQNLRDRKTYQLYKDYLENFKKGVQSRCICPECFFVCSACIGTSGGQPLDLDSLRMLSLLREAQGDGTDEDEEY